MQAASKRVDVSKQMFLSGFILMSLSDRDSEKIPRLPRITGSRVDVKFCIFEPDILYEIVTFTQTRPLFSGWTNCGFPGAPAHSTVSFSPSDVVREGTVATYGCDRGFELLGPARRVCGNNGTWGPQGIPFCGE